MRPTLPPCRSFALVLFQRAIRGPVESSRLVDLAGEQIDPGQQAERAMAFVLMIPREARMAAWHWRQIRCRRGDGLDSRLLVVRDDRDRLLRFSPPWQRLFSG